LACADGDPVGHDGLVNQPVDVGDPRAAVRAPFGAALNGIITRAVIGFSVVTVLTVIPLLVPLDETIHAIAHLVLPIGWLAYAVMGEVANRREPPVVGNPWAPAAEAEPGQTRFAIVVTGFMIGGWLAAVVAVLVHHHLGSPTDVAYTFAVYVPSMVVPWALASWVFVRHCARSLARAETRSNDMLRIYWRGIGR
jgi:hypothetical protein